MLFTALFFSELVVLYFLSRRVINLVYNIFFKITKSKKWSGYLLALIFFPGTFIHEMSHALTALFLLVPFGEVRLIPQFEDDVAGTGGGIKMGSFGIAKIDPFRRFLIGVAPFIVGVFVILTAVHSTSMIRINEVIWWKKILGMLIIFEVGNMMFASKKGSKGARSFVANRGNTVYIGVVSNVTVAESARVLKTMGMENALNLDSGGSTALWSGGYKLGPGRDLPNAVLFVKK